MGLFSHRDRPAITPISSRLAGRDVASNSPCEPWCTWLATTVDTLISFLQEKHLHSPNHKQSRLLSLCLFVPLLIPSALLSGVLLCCINFQVRAARRKGLINGTKMDPATTLNGNLVVLIAWNLSFNSG